jgi:putative CRISPR-associated protein (TIGR02619 family)
MPRHLIVSCGTSQIDKLSKLGNKGIDDYINGANLPKDNFGSPNDSQVTSYLDGKIIEQIANALTIKWIDETSAIGKRHNRLGAEISTLWKMKTSDSMLFDSKNDFVTIFYSDTYRGAFVAALLKKLLQASPSFAMNAEHVAVQRVAGLKGNTQTPTEGETNLAKMLYELCATCKKKDQDISLVVTGGYKSVIPLFTISSLLNGAPMHYLFEESDKLRTLNLQVTTELTTKRFSFRKVTTLGESATISLNQAIKELIPDIGESSL